MKRLYLVIGIVLIISILSFTLFFLMKPKSDIESRVKITDIKVTDRLDSISYALGTVWAYNVTRYLGIHTIKYSFYRGVKDYLAGDSSIIGIYAANELLKQRINEIKNESLYPKNGGFVNFQKIQLKTKYDTFSYTLGFAWTFGAYGIGISEVSPSLLAGLERNLSGDTSIFGNYQSATNYLMAYVEELRLKKFADVKKKNDDWLMANKNSKGIITRPDGLQYKIIKSGKGKSPSESDAVECNYTSKLIDGSIFENAYKTGKSYKFYPGSVIPGCAEAISLMKEGDIWEIYVPYNLAYGSGGVYGKVPPYATVIIDLEFLNILKNN